MAKPLFVERIHILGPPGFHAAVKQAARDEGQTTSEFIRSATHDKFSSVLLQPDQLKAGAD